MAEDDSRQISDRLDIIIRLLLEGQRKESNDVTVGDQIGILESNGLKGKDVAKILGIDVSQLPSYRRSAKAKHARRGLS